MSQTVESVLRLLKSAVQRKASWVPLMDGEFWRSDLYSGNTQWRSGRIYFLFLQWIMGITTSWFLKRGILSWWLLPFCLPLSSLHFPACILFFVKLKTLSASVLKINGIQFILSHIYWNNKEFSSNGSFLSNVNQEIGAV